MSTAPWFRPYEDYDIAYRTKYAAYMALPTAAAKRARLPELKRELALDNLLRTRPASISAATYEPRARAFVGANPTLSAKALTAAWRKEKAVMKAEAGEASFLAGALRVPKSVPADMREQYKAAARESAEGSAGMPVAERRQALAAAIDDFYTTAITLQPITLKKNGTYGQLAHDQVVLIPTRLMQELPMGSMDRDSAPFTKLLEVLNKAKEFDLVELIGTRIHSKIDHVIVTVGGSWRGRKASLHRSAASRLRVRLWYALNTSPCT